MSSRAAAHHRATVRCAACGRPFVLHRTERSRGLCP
ncbi:hypothetical protein BPC006_I1856 [Burkholderia pseudomallei BPC006]|nr:hypothetical protein BPC006_I1856 [Burkholderia pseudomallei BPC006]KGC70922.1 hypothetical protein DM75_4064 [Burkholderia mallei]KOT02879.1 hypothetical protein DM50_4060 [Burkholderia mallei]